jgi:hypothetical protein
LAECRFQVCIEPYRSNPDAGRGEAGGESPWGEEKWAIAAIGRVKVIKAMTMPSRLEKILGGSPGGVSV